jgi:hypothetical protein
MKLHIHKLAVLAAALIFTGVSGAQAAGAKDFGQRIVAKAPTPTALLGGGAKDFGQ